MKGQLDKLFWKLYGECSKCRVSFETDLKIKGKYVDYAKEIKQGNVKDWMKDLEAVAKDFIEETDRKGYVSETGRIEDWSGQNKKELEKTINESVKKLKQDLTSQLENLTNDK